MGNPEIWATYIGSCLQRVDSERDVRVCVENYNGYTFRYVNDRKSLGKVKIYVERQPSYGSRDASPSVTHLHPASGNAPQYITLAEAFKPSALADAQRIARAWADANDVYIRTGRIF